MTLDFVEILDVGPRDGLQNEETLLATSDKIALISRLIDAGIRRLEVASFVHLKLVPQMADAEAVVAGLPARDDVTYVGLVLNEKGFERALETKNHGGGINEIGCVAVVSDSFSQKNQGQSAEESVSISLKIMKRAVAEGVPVQVTISASFGCPFEGEIDPARVVEMARQLAEGQPREIAIADTIGVAVPVRVEDMFFKLQEALPHIPLRGHFHDTRNTGVANSWAAVKAGAKTIDASIGGLGGCPFAPRATGNVATEDVAFMFERSGVKTGLDLDKLISSAHWVGELLGGTTPGMVSRAGSFPT